MGTFPLDEDEDWVDFDDEPDAPEITYREAVARLQQLAAKRSDVRVDWDGLQKPQGRWRADADVSFPDADVLLRFKSAAQFRLFERLVSAAHPLPERHAVWYPQDGVIIARLVGEFDQFHRTLIQSFGMRWRPGLDTWSPAHADLAGMLASTGAFSVNESADGSGRSLRLVSVPPELAKLYRMRQGRGLFPCLELSGVAVSSAEEALNALDALGTSYLFGLAQTHGASLRLWNTGYLLGSRRGPSYSKKVRFPQQQFDAEPAELFAAGNAEGRRLVERYLNYYQVLEFYMPKAADSEVARQGVAERAEAKSPFPRSRKFPNLMKEQCQLDAVINCATTENEIAKLMRDQELFATLTDPKIIMHVEVLDCDQSGAPLGNVDYRMSIASRVYDIRNRIVHAKEGGDTKGRPPLGLHGREARDLTADLRLVRYLAEKALRYWATPLPPH